MSLSRRDFLRFGAGMLFFGFPVPDIPPDFALPQPNIIPREQWGASPPNHQARYENGFYNADENPFGWRVYDDPAAIYKTVVLHPP